MDDIKIITEKIIDYMGHVSNIDETEEAKNYLIGYIDACKDKGTYEMPEAYEALENLVDVIFS